ncbi:hypothetical protein GALMADRAFT_225564 [Galerina marginata CBS 339.88]|uniref:Uncharacterized protein n=1 Tax=Galerina marginata (strain CBS 339.88) TaxID=685588 RepID=A0A067T9E9_GALM3|nr:hypothetical protein GALMADRAFT_225564 [Galerina marginata CBS 339.88]
MVNIKIDDRDSSVAYSPRAAWLPTGDRGEWLTTSTSTSSGGAFASLTFTGSGVSIWGTIPNTTQGGHPQLSFAVDNQPVVIQNPSQMERKQYQDKIHPVRPPSNRCNAYVADYPSSGFITVTTSGTSPTQQAPVLDTSLPVSQTFESAPQTFTPAPSQRNTTKAPPIAVILGVGIGSVAFLLVVILMLLKRRSTKNSDSNAKNASCTSFFLTLHFWPGLHGNYTVWSRWLKFRLPLHSSSFLASRPTPFPFVENSSLVLNQQKLLTQKRLADASVYYGEGQVTSPPPYEVHGNYNICTWVGDRIVHII